jgi:pseudolysin
MQRKLYKLIWGMIVLCASFHVATLWAAKAVNLRQQPLNLSTTFVAMPTDTDYKVINSATDQNQTTHIRLQQTYKNYLVWGATAVMHVPNAGNAAPVTTLTQLHATVAGGASDQVTYNGIIYQDLAGDLNNTPQYVFESAQADKLLAQSITRFQEQTATRYPITNSKATLVVYVDDHSKAHWAYLVTFKSEPKSGLPARPVSIIDALNSTIYEQWDDVLTLVDVEAGGFGGNQKIGKKVYDGIGNDLPKLIMDRNPVSNKCLVENDEVAVKDRRLNDAVVSFRCASVDGTHKIYWNGAIDEVNGGYSPSNDALYAGKLIKALYQDWYKLPVLTDIWGSPLWLYMRVHENLNNAYWDGDQMTFGDGSDVFYPMVSLGIVAHEVSHGFTHQHSGLVGGGQAGGLNESFSDMAAQALEYYIYKHNDWLIGAEILKTRAGALRYMDEPTKDCPKGHLPGVGCSISNMKQYFGRLDVHAICGVFNKLFYTLATTPGWNTKKAFDVMVQANVNYWVNNTTYIEAACGVVNAAKDLKYDIKAVDSAAAAVGINTAVCYQTPAPVTVPLPTPTPKPAPAPKPIPTKPTPVPQPDDDDDSYKTNLGAG